ncbi:MAG: ATP-binding cassette domain-containing protein, partial [Opitutales bacterium]|nr:ATP-binding cassette domain-containing protein [Opitutales bacterium]
MSAPAPAEIRTQGLVKTFGPRTVVDRVSVHFRAGEVVGLLGPNGAGKTTMFYMIVGLVPASAGQVTLDGTDLTRLRMHERARHGIGYLPQEPSVFRKLTVAENLLAIVETTAVPRRERAACVRQHLDELSLGHVAQQKA